MFYGYEQPVDMPVPELYDTGIMQMYLQAVKDQYDKGEKRMEDFISKYGDFTSPFQKDVEAYQNLGMGRINDIYDQLVAQGIDPLRSREGQAVMARAIREAPKDKLNQLRQSAKVGEEYLKAKAELQSKGLFSQQMEDYFLKHPFEDWNTTEYGMFDRTSPLQYKDIHSITDDWFKHIDKKYNDTLTKKKNDGYDYYTVDENDIKGIIKSNINDFLSSDYGKFYYDQAVKKAKILNPNADESKIKSEAMNILNEDIVNRNSDYLKNDRKANEYALLDYKDKLDRANQAREWAHQERMEALKNSKKFDGNQNYHQNLLQLGLYNLSGKTDYDTSDDRYATATQAKTNLNKTVTELRRYANHNKLSAQWIVDRTVQATLLVGSSENIDLIGNRFKHTKNANYGNVKINNKNYNGLILNHSEMTRLISKNNWAAMTTGNALKYSSVLHNNIGKLSKQVKTVTGKDGSTEKNVARYRFYFVPYNYNNVATTVDKKGAAIQANRGKLYAVDIKDDKHYKDLGEVYMPFNRTHPTSSDGKSKTNEIITDEGMRSSVDAEEARVRGVLGIKGTDKGSNTGDYDY